MALQKRRRGPARTAQQRSAWMRKSGQNRPLVQGCPNCGSPRIPHRVCAGCGFYNGKKVAKARSTEAAE
ncbi:MAG: 50S ribosomal protein L32 [Kofleriaceae bacterium]|nr:50S ribosomal protein L32 [Myxococcales bacterium]MCB9564088.1 50S ribosomal protein L32 [Kofleriaceae bacterium]MCB9572544.1 50S ribosomal protein L32 [Kofleriaceae bacterium]